MTLYKRKIKMTKSKIVSQDGYSVQLLKKDNSYTIDPYIAGRLQFLGFAKIIGTEL